MSDDNVIPFGKYKGQPVEVLQSDDNYREWLMNQPWLKDKFPLIQQLIINNFQEPTETPEHNALQVRFLDEKFVTGFLYAIGRWDRPEEIEVGGVSRAPTDAEWEEVQKEWVEDRKVKFEVGGFDVVVWDGLTAIGVELKVNLSDDYPAVLRQVTAAKVLVKRFAGDKETPDIINRRVVLADNFSAKGATLKQVTDIFARSGVTLLIAPRPPLQLKR